MKFSNRRILLLFLHNRESQGLLVFKTLVNRPSIPRPYFLEYFNIRLRPVPTLMDFRTDPDLISGSPIE